jgi:hypothetical protein
MSLGDEFLERASKRYKAELQDQSNVIVVPELDDLTFYYRPMNIKQRDQIFKLINEGKWNEACAEAIIVRARDENGKRMFRESHRHQFLTGVSPKIVERIAGEMNTFDKDIEDEREDAQQSESGANLVKKS